MGAAELQRRLAVARGDEPADLVIRGGRVLCVFTREWLDADVAIVDGVVAGLGSYEGVETLDAAGRWLVPGFIDPHMHIETSKLLIDEFARLVLPLGTTAVVADPHEIANVLGTDGVHWLCDAAGELPLDVYFTASSCVPASQFESPRRALSTGDLEGLLRRRNVVGLAEMMNFPGVVAGDEGELAKLALARHVDGHAPGLTGHALNAYAAAGIESDHEAATAEEGRERLRAGLWLLIRQASRGTEPRGAPATRARVRAPSDGVLHGRSRARAHRRRRAHQRDRPRRGRARALTRGRRRDGVAQPGDIPRPRPPRSDLAWPPRRHPRPRRPRVLRAGGRSQARPPRRDDRAGRCARVGEVHGAHRADRPGLPRGALAAEAAPGSSGSCRTRSSPRRSRTSSRPSTASRWPTPRATWRRSPCSSATSRPAGSGSGSSAASGSSEARSGRASPTTRTTSWSSASTTARSSPSPSGSATSAAAWSWPTARTSSPSCRSPLRGSFPTSARRGARLRAARWRPRSARLGVTFPQPVQMLAFLSLSVIPSLKITDRGLVDVERFELVPLAAGDN